MCFLDSDTTYINHNTLKQVTFSRSSDVSLMLSMGLTPSLVGLMLEPLTPTALLAPCALLLPLPSSPDIQSGDHGRLPPPADSGTGGCWHFALHVLRLFVQYSTVYEDAENGYCLQVASTPVFCKYNWPSYASFYILFYVPCHQLLAASQRDPVGESGMSWSRLCGCQQEHPDLYTTQPGTVHFSNFLHCTSWDTEIDFM